MTRFERVRMTADSPISPGALLSLIAMTATTCTVAHKGMPGGVTVPKRYVQRGAFGQHNERGAA